MNDRDKYSIKNKHKQNKILNENNSNIKTSLLHIDMLAMCGPKSRCAPQMFHAEAPMNN